MNRTKKFFALLLAFVLAPGVGATAMAEEAIAFETEAAEVWLQAEEYVIKYGTEIALNAERIPEEYAGWDVSYQWEVYGSGVNKTGVIERATDPGLHLIRSDAEYPGKGQKILGLTIRPATGNYYCYATVRSADGDEVRLLLFRAKITAEPSWFGRAVNFVVMGLSSIVLAPIVWLIFHLPNIFNFG